MAVTHSDKVAARLKEWRRALIDTTRRNKLLNFRPTKASTVEIVDELPQQVLGQLLNGGAFYFDPKADEEDSEEELITTFPKIPRWKKRGTDVGRTSGRELDKRHTDNRLQTPLTAKRLDRNLLRISRLAESSLEEQGVNTLFLALGMLEWYEDRGSDVVNKAPVLLAPVVLQREDASSPFRLRYRDDETVMNPALVERLRSNFDLELPALPDLWEDVDFDDIFLGVRSAVSGFERWRVTNDMALGLFSFYKFIMFKDLEKNEEHFHQNDLIRALSGEDTKAGRGRLPPEIAGADLDEAMSPWNAHLVLDADSSQQRAILAVREGQNLVIEGPPGTGKSQTITNIIAQALADDRTVLFVSEKMAALEVVQTRLESVGLGAFCLELHSHKVAKRAFVSELARSLDAVHEVDVEGDEELSQLRNVTHELRQYVEALHAPFGALNRSPFDAFGRLNQLGDAADVEPEIPGLDACTPEQLRQALDYLRELERYAAEFHPLSSQPLYGLEIARVQRRDRQRFDELLTTARNALGGLIEETSRLGDMLGFAEAERIGDIELQLEAAGIVGRSPGGERSVLQAPGWNELGADVAELLEMGNRWERLSPHVLKRFVPDVLEEDLTLEVELYEEHLDSVFRFFKPSFWKIRTRLRSFSRPAYKASGSELIEDLRKADECRRAKALFERMDRKATELFGRRWEGEESDFQDLKDFADWVLSLRAFALEELLTERGLEVVSQASVDESEVAPVVAAVSGALDEAREALTEFAEFSHAVESSDVLVAPGMEIRLAAERLAGFAEAKSDLRRWAAMNAVIAELRAGPAREFVATALDSVSPGNLADSFERAFLLSWVDLAIAERPSLRDFRTSRQQNRLETFQALDRQSMEIAEQRIAAALERRRQRLLDPSLSRELSLVQREAGKRSRIRPVRQLLRLAPQAVQLIKPCFMMSPLSVAQFADPEHLHFDLLVFDEASQITPADAVGSFIRADQVVVVGDSKQLPPTNFFNSQIETPEEMDPDEDLDAVIHDDLESILAEGQATAGVPSLRLKWHYRSEDESLIRFSNEEFYADDPLYTFPNAHPRATERGLKFEYVADGVYEGRGVNSREAEAVADAIVQHICEHPELSLGVGTFGLKQQTRIQDVLERRRRENPSLEFFFAREGEQKFFVKNLENIQGDDRDVIFLSVTYGPDSHGRIRRNFGPINRDNGWRRLNVITTRAKKRMRVFSSMRADEIDLSGSIAEGVHYLHRYLKYAETGSYPTTSVTDADTDSPFEDGVIAALKDRGYDVVPQVGEAGYRIDIGVVDPELPGRFICGIECDGAAYHSAATVRDRDRLRQDVLESRGWEIHRVWSTDWFHDREGQTERLIRLIEQSRNNEGRQRAFEPTRERVGGCSPNPEPRMSPPREQEKDEEAKPELGEIDVPLYRITEVRVTGQPDEFYEASVQRVAEVVARVVNVEGPIHRDELTRRVAAHWGLQRAGSRISRKICKVADRGCDQAVVRRDDFYWPSSMKRPPVRSRNVDGEQFSSDHICEEEAAEAVRLLLEHRAPLRPDDIVREATRLLGFKRAGKKLQDLVQQAVQHLVDRGELRPGGTGLRLSNDGRSANAAEPSTGVAREDSKETPVKREYLQSSIGELEEIVRANPEDRITLTKIWNELAHRKTERATRLRRQIESILGADGVG